MNDDHELQMSLKRDAEGLITQGVVVGDVVNQNIELIVRGDKNEIAQDPSKGVGVINYIDDEGSEGLIRAIRTELTKDGMRVTSIEMVSNELVIDATYE